MQTPEFGDCLGVESSADLKSYVDYSGAFSRRRRRIASAMQREFPPPISWLERSESLRSHVPWVMRRYCTSDGRLIINEERVGRRGYFLSDRSNGRLQMSLVHVNDVVGERCDAVDDQLSGEGGGGGGEERNGGSMAEEVAAESKYYGMGIKARGGFLATAPLLLT